MRCRWDVAQGDVAVDFEYRVVVCQLRQSQCVGKKTERLF